MVIDKPNKFPSLLVLTGGFDKGGAERRILTLIKSLSRKGFNVNIGVFSRKFDADQSKLPDISLDYLGTRRLMPLVPIFKILRLISSAQPDIVFSNLRRLNTISMITKILSFSDKMVFILGVSNNPNYHPNSLFTRLMYKHADGLIANSHGTKNYLCNEWGLDEKNIHVIQNGVQSNEITLLAKDDSLFEWYKESLPIIITIGRLSPQKNHACLIKAFSIVRERMQSRLVIIGEGPLRQSLEELARIVCVDEDTWFAGYQNNPYKFLARSTVFVLPSKWEGFPNVLLEAMVCRVPVISTDIDFGPGEMIDHGKTGFLVPNNDPETLAAQIQYVLENRSGTAIKGIISNARKKVETEFSLEVMVKKYQEYFTDVYNSHYAWLH
mgnify:CR=1 FL=1